MTEPSEKFTWKMSRSRFLFGHMEARAWDCPKSFKPQFLSCSLQTLSFSKNSFSGVILNPTKRENEFPSRGKPEIARENIPPQQWRFQTRAKDHNNRGTEKSWKWHLNTFDNFDDFDRTKFRCLGFSRTSLQLQWARHHCYACCAPWTSIAQCVCYSQNDSKTHQISRKHKHMRVIQSQVKHRILPLDWVCGLYPGTILSLIAIQVWCEVTTNRPRRQTVQSFLPKQAEHPSSA